MLPAIIQQMIEDYESRITPAEKRMEARHDAALKERQEARAALNAAIAATNAAFPDETDFSKMWFSPQWRNEREAQIRYDRAVREVNLCDRLLLDILNTNPR